MSDQEHIRDEFSPLLDDELSPDARDALETALAQDAELLRELDSLRKVDELYRGLPRESAPVDLADRVRAELHPPAIDVASTATRSRWNLYAGLAAAAVFGVVIGGLVLRQEFVVSTPPEQLAARQAEVAAPTEAKAGTAQEEMEVAAGPERESEDLFAAEQPAAAAPSDEAADAPQTLERALSESATLPDAARDTAAGAREPAAAPPPPAPMAESEATRDAQGLSDLGDAQPMQKAEADDSLAAAETRAAMRQQDPARERTIGERIFERRQDGWYEEGYDRERTRALSRDEVPATENPVADWARLLQFKQAVIFKHDGDWYRIPPRVEE